MKKTLNTSKVAVAAAFALVVGLVATGLPAHAADTSTLKPTAAQLSAWKGKTITYMFYNDSQPELDTTKAMITDFQNLTGATVNLEVVPFASEDQLLGARVAANNAPDVARLANPGLYQKYSINLDKVFGKTYRKEFLAGSYNQVLDATSKALIGVPYDLTINGPIINVDQFKAAGVAVPTKWTWDELIADAKKVQAFNKTEFAFAIDKSGHRLATVLSQFDSYYIDRFGGNGLKKSTSRAVPALQMITDLYRQDLAPKDLWIGSGSKYAAPNAIFAAGQVPVYFSGNFALAALSTQAKFNFAAVPNPCATNCGGYPGGKFLIGFNTSKTPDLAAYFVNWLTQPAQMEKIDKAGLWLPTRNDLVAKGITYPTRQADMAVYLADAAKTPALAYSPQLVPTVIGGIYNKLRDLTTDVIAKKITAKQAIATEVAFIDAQLATLSK